MTYITVYNLSINSNYRILTAELNYRFTNAVHNLLNNLRRFIQRLPCISLNHIIIILGFIKQI